MSEVWIVESIATFLDEKNLDHDMFCLPETFDVRIMLIFIINI